MIFNMVICTPWHEYAIKIINFSFIWDEDDDGRMDQRISVSEGRYIKEKKVEGLSLKKQNNSSSAWEMSVARRHQVKY